MIDLLILHGALGSAGQLSPLSAAFSANYRVHTIDFSGHGAQKMTADAFSIPLFAKDVLRFMDNKGLKQVSILGYSMGGYVAMYLAKHHPHRVNKIITLATKYEWTEAIAVKEVQMLNPEKIEQKLPAFAATLNERHTANNWKDVLNNTAAMMLSLGADSPLKIADYATITHPSLILLGDRDKMVTLAESIAVYKALPNAQMCILPDTAHPIDQADAELLLFMVKRFLG